MPSSFHGLSRPRKPISSDNAVSCHSPAPQKQSCRRQPVLVNAPGMAIRFRTSASGLRPTLAITNSVRNAIAMGLTTTFAAHQFQLPWFISMMRKLSATKAGRIATFIAGYRHHGDGGRLSGEGHQHSCSVRRWRSRLRLIVANLASSRSAPKPGAAMAVRWKSTMDGLGMGLGSFALTRPGHPGAGGRPVSHFPLGFLRDSPQFPSPGYYSCCRPERFIAFDQYLAVDVRHLANRRKAPALTRSACSRSGKNGTTGGLPA